MPSTDKPAAGSCSDPGVFRPRIERLTLEDVSEYIQDTIVYVPLPYEIEYENGDMTVFDEGAFAMIICTRITKLSACF